MALTIHGDKALLKALKKLPDRIQRRVLRKAVGRGTTVVHKRAKATAPVDSGRYKSSLRKKTKTYKRAGVVVGIVGASHDDAPHQYWIESGTVKMPAMHHMSKVLRDTETTARAAMMKGLGKGIEKEASRA